LEPNNEFVIHNFAIRTYY